MSEVRLRLLTITLPEVVYTKRANFVEALSHYRQSSMLALVYTVAIFHGIINTAATIAQRSSVTFFDPTAQNGSFFDNAGNGLGEPLNVSFCLPHKSSNDPRSVCER